MGVADDPRREAGSLIQRPGTKPLASRRRNRGLAAEGRAVPAGHQSERWLDQFSENLHRPDPIIRVRAPRRRHQHCCRSAEGSNLPLMDSVLELFRRAIDTDDDSFRMPRLDSIARRLIEDWLHGC